MKILYWFLLIPLFLAQFFFAQASQTQIRYEELAESVRNPFWLENGYIYDGVSSNIGWYGTLMLWYRSFGFDIFAAKIVRLLLHGISLVAIAYLLKRFMGERVAWVPLLVIGLSPTLLYFNTLQASYGIDLQYAPLILALIVAAYEQKRLWMRLVLCGVGWALAMVAWMSYPTFLLYLPVLGIVYFLTFWGHAGGKRLFYITTLVSIISFLLPLIIGIYSVKNRDVLLYDEERSSGIFRGAGGEGLDVVNVSVNLGGAIRDLFVVGNSYHFQLPAVEFSYILPILSILSVFGVGRLAAGRWKTSFILGTVFLIVSLLATSFAADPSGAPGIRRFTPFLSAFYVLFVISWYATMNRQWKEVWQKYVVFGLGGLLLVHHLVVYPMNLASLAQPSPGRESMWFAGGATPRDSLEAWVTQIRTKDVQLGCFDERKNPLYCRYSEIFAGVAGSCVWNDLGCHELYGYDLKTRQFIPLRIQLWNEGYFEH